MSTSSLEPLSQSGTNLDILPASWRDLNELRRLEQECFAHDAWPLFDLLAVLTLPGIVRLKVEVDQRMAAFIAGDPRPEEQVGWVTTLAVSPAFRRQGLASRLLERCEELMNMNRIRLSVRRSNYAALALYYKHGYHQIDVWQGYYNGGEDALVLEKERIPIGG